MLGQVPEACCRLVVKKLISATGAGERLVSGVVSFAPRLCMKARLMIGFVLASASGVLLASLGRRLKALEPDVARLGTHF